ncbi:MAG TPA: hypothetical protein VFF65_07775 [Phycisphaerales bacterium]|nr:hypothetical protein [Phycisphaerales bacterium]
MKTTATIQTTNPRRRPAPRGVALVEVVAASALLAITASAVVGGLATVAGADARNHQRLESLELANRLLLQYIDDSRAMPDQALHVQQGRGLYRWRLGVAPAGLSTPGGSLIDLPASGPGAQALDKLNLLTVAVYTAVPDGAGGYTDGERLCSLARVHHPLSLVYRNPDALSRGLADPSVLIDWFTSLTSAATTATHSPRNTAGVASRAPAAREGFNGSRAANR